MSELLQKIYLELAATPGVGDTCRTRNVSMQARRTGSPAMLIVERRLGREILACGHSLPIPPLKPSAAKIRAAAQYRRCVKCSMGARAEFAIASSALAPKPEEAR